MMHFTMISLEPLQERHRKGVIDVVNLYIATTTSAYPQQPLDYAQFDGYLDNAQRLCGFAVVDAGSVVGFCQLKPYRDMDTFDHTVELTYFLEPGSTGKGIGGLVLTRLIEEARARNKTQLLASISGENTVSLKFHAKHGFVESGRLRNIGHKFGRDFDVVLMQRRL